MSSTPVPRATPLPERDAQLLSIGKQCSEATCHMVDFLPFKCQHCKQSFCQEHFKVEAHRCPEYDESKHDRVAPNCPLCNTPVAIPPGQDPNLRMDAHLTNECSVMTGRAKAKSLPVCAKGGCKKVLFSPIKCTHCREQFCPSHRFPADHSCSAPAPKPGLSTSKTAGSRLLNEFNGTKLNNKVSAASSAVKKTVSSASVSIASAKVSAPALNKSSSSSNSSSTKSPGNNPFSKVDSVVSLPSPMNFTHMPSPNPCSTSASSMIPERHDNATTNSESTISVTTFKRESYAPPPLFACRRAKAERESRVKAMQQRAKKGLLSEEKKVILAEEEAALKEDKDCVIM
ncbi:AN1-type zinc finger protein 2A [Leucoagaricus sp. SymC.cos]|nr:AN1-type zinc finger protein 2A [Leucoagaricus sp. SymC.cos]